MRFLEQLFAKTRLGALRCSFCNKSQHDVRKLVAGPFSFICNECIDICVDIVADDEKAYVEQARAHGETASCVLCSRIVPSTDYVSVPNRGAVCLVCVGAVKLASGSAWRKPEKPDSSTETRDK